jgi:diguanylate cyclase (GGDEF)-like protein/PAS domain S-box-containing protein
MNRNHDFESSSGQSQVHDSAEERIVSVLNDVVLSFDVSSPDEEFIALAHGMDKRSAAFMEAYKDPTARIRLFELAVELANDPVVITTAQLDRPGPQIIYVNRAFTRMSGYKPEEVIGCTPRMLQGPETNRTEMARLRHELITNGSFAGQAVNYHRDGKTYFVEWSVSALFDESGEASHYVAIQRDVTERKRHEMQIEEQKRELAAANEKLAHANRRMADLSHTDSLTGLENHRSFHQRLEEETIRAKRYDTPLALVLLDIDNFKGYNDTFGHAAGDKALQFVALILREASRRNDIVARHGGEEFALLLPHTDLKGALSVAEQLRMTIETAPWPYRRVTASFGVAALDADMTTNNLVRFADAALVASKEKGRNLVTKAA